MKITPTSLPDVLLVEPDVRGDERGFFMETYHVQKMAAGGITASFVQDNHSGSRRGTLRGLHYQIRQPQGKLLRVVAGEIYDVAVDLRRSSPTFGQSVGVYLGAENRRQLWVPAGFAHGFYVVSEWAELVYKATDLYAPQWERTLLWNDPALEIAWPLDDATDLILSPRDQDGTALKDAELYD
jgi:dTDP-4-dehydrorhamnose 3,5-epimerase